MPPAMHRIIRQALILVIIGSLILPAPVFAMPIEEARPLAPSATYTVTSTLDDGSAGTLRWAIDQANTNTGSDTIGFAIGVVGSPQTITLTAALPDITEQVLLDGWSQGGAGYTGAPLIELNGGSAGNVNGLTLSGGDSIVRGLVINRFGSDGIAIFSANNKIQGNYIGIDTAGASAQGNGDAGVFIYSGSGNIIGTDGDGTNDAAERNVISGNGYYGLNLNGGDGNVVAGNFIGLNAAGTAAVGNLGAGITIFTSNNRIGTNADGVSDAAERNVISGQIDNSGAGQPGFGIQTVGSGTSNVIAGNTIGLNAAGTAAIGNPNGGIWLSSDDNRVGTNGDGVRDNFEGNVISGNQMGLRFLYSHNNVAAGNFIGTDVTGVTAIPNTYWGVYFDGGGNNLLGTDGNGVGDLAERNIVAGNGYDGIVFVGGSGNSVAGDYIGLNVNGDPLGNANNGISLGNGASGNRIGTDGSNDSYNLNERNVIAANNGQGIQIFGDTSNNNVIAGNLIGVNPAVTTTGGNSNAMDGISILQSSGNRIGTNSDGVADAEEANVIGGNGFAFFGGGISISEGNNQIVAGNFIGTDPSNTLDLGNNSHGLRLAGGTGNTIGSNIIRYGKNAYANGIQLYGYNAQTTGNVIINNIISNNPLHGIDNYATETYPGSTAPGNGPADNTILSNTIINNGGYGIHDYGSSPEIRGNVIQYNYDSGIYNEVNFGNGTDPATAGDDYLSRPAIISNTILGNCQKEVGCGGGIISIDTAPSNAATLAADNVPAYNIGSFIAQSWYGTAEVIQGGTPIASSVTLSDNAGGTRTLAYSTGPCANLNNTIIHGDQYNVSCNDVASWPLFMEYQVDGTGVRTDYMPVTSTSPAIAVYSFDANTVTNPTDTGVGFSGEGITTGLLSRYQVMQVTIVDQPITGLTASNDSPTVLGNPTNFVATVTSGNNIVYTWGFGDGNTGTGQYPAYTYGTIGYYTAIVTASNSVSTLTAITPVTITDAPIAGLTASNDSPTTLGQPTNFSASVTSGNVTLYTWNFGNGSAEVNGQTPAYTYGTVGYYTAIVTATDGVNTLVATTPVTISAGCTSGLVVINTNDSGCGSLRYAVDIAVAGDTVTFTPTLAGQTIFLTTGQIDIDQSITIDGSGAPGITVSGNGNSRVFNATLGTIILSYLTIRDGYSNEGAGLRVNSGAVTLNNSAVLSNTLSGLNSGGGILVATGASLSINNSTVSGNRASYDGGGVLSLGVLTVTNSTITNNCAGNCVGNGGGGLEVAAGTAVIRNNIIAGNSADAGWGPDCYAPGGTLYSYGYNLIQNRGGNCPITQVINPGTDLFSVDPQLGSLQDNGGPTWTYLPQAGSPVIDAGNNANAAGLIYDQRGPGYPRIVNGTVDIGAVEAPVTVTPMVTVINDSPTVLGGLTSFTATVSGFTPVTYTWNFGDGSAEVAGPSNLSAYTYSAAGFYTAIVTATDGTGTTASATTPITITAGCTSGLVVINTNDSGCGSLRYAVSIATPGDTVTFTPTLAAQTITLTTAQIDIDQSITIDGAAAPGITVSGNDNDRVFNVYAQIDVTLNALSIVHGWVGEDTGAGISNAGTLTVSNSTIAYNDGMIGGGIYNGGRLTLLNSTLSFNTSWEGSGFYNSGLATVANDTFTQNQANRFGGGVYNDYNAVMVLTNSTLSANSVLDVEMGRGGGLFNGGSLTIVNSTIYSNTSLVANSGGGLYNDEGAGLSLANTLIAYSSGGDCHNIGTIASNVNNLVGDGSCSAALSGDPLLGPLANNGGSTLTHLPQIGSPAIDVGDNASAAGLTYDQRGPGYPRIVNGTVDIGAAEVAAIVAPILTVTNDSPTVLGTPTNLTATLSSLMTPPATFTWNFGDGFIGTGATPTHTYHAAGLYTATVQAANRVLTLTATTLVTITAPTTRYATYLPLIMNNSFTAPDLIVQTIIASRDVITVVIKNIGDAPAVESFWVDAYIAPNPPPAAVNQIWWDQNRSQQGVAWAVDEPIVPIQPGQVITLTSNDIYVSPERTSFTGNLPAGTPIYAQVDSYNFYTNYGAVHEQHEILGLPYNNILGPVYSTASATHPVRATNRSTTALLASTVPFRPVRP